MFSFNVFIEGVLSRWQNHYCGWQSSRRNLSATGWTIADANTLHKSTFQPCSWCQHIRYVWSWRVIKKETIKHTFHKQMTRSLFKTGMRFCREQRTKIICINYSHIPNMFINYLWTMNTKVMTKFPVTQNCVKAYAGALSFKSSQHHS